MKDGQKLRNAQQVVLAIDQELGVVNLDKPFRRNFNPNKIAEVTRFTGRDRSGRMRALTPRVEAQKPLYVVEEIEETPTGRNTTRAFVAARAVHVNSRLRPSVYIENDSNEGNTQMSSRSGRTIAVAEITKDELNEIKRKWRNR